jgi:hypothetical protein
VQFGSYFSILGRRSDYAGKRGREFIWIGTNATLVEPLNDPLSAEQFEEFVAFGKTEEMIVEGYVVSRDLYAIW